MKYLLLLTILITGCEYKCENASVQELTLKSCSKKYGCYTIDSRKKVCEVERLDNKCKYYIPSEGSSYWADCQD